MPWLLQLGLIEAIALALCMLTSAGAQRGHQAPRLVLRPLPAACFTRQSWTLLMES
jgi:hypothetical protein